MRISLIVALDQHGLIGVGNALPWRLSADLKHFKALTMGKPIIMGRKTCESIGRPLPGRRNLVLTRNADFNPAGFEVFRDVESLVLSIQGVDDAMVIGGAEVYRVFLERADRLYVTEVAGNFAGDTWFPVWPLGPEWREVTRENRPADEQNPHAMAFVCFEKVENS